MYFLFDEFTLMFVLFCPALMVFVVFAIILWKNPEAREWIKLWFKGGVMFHIFNDAGLYRPRRTKPYAEGQFMAGKDKFGKREIYQVPKINNPFMTKRFISTGIHRPNFFAYSGKTVGTNAEALAAIEITETKKKKELPNGVRQWAKNAKIDVPVLEKLVEEVELPDGSKTKVETVKEKARRIVEVLTLDPRKLRFYFSEHYDEGPYDALLERKWQEGYQAGRSGRGLENTLIAIGFGLILGALIMLILAMQGVI